MPSPELAPIQLYIVLAITVATFGWLLSPMRLETLSAKETWAPVVFIGIQLAAILMYGSLPNWAASDVHQLTLILYGLIAARLFRGAWVYSRNRALEMPPL